jgi:dTDP-4-dehydrorhamnose reductase
MVSDQRLTPTFTGDLAAGLLQALDRELSGLLHLTSAGECSWLEFTEEILDIAGVDASVEAVTTTVRPGEPRRPLNGVLEIELARSAGVTMRPWTDALRDYMRQADFAAVSQSP